jgi:hypothetical protein
MIETTVNKSSTVTVPTSKTITIRPASLQQNSMNKNQQQIIVIPQSMLVNGCISAKDLKSIIGEKKSSNQSIKTLENRTNLKRPAPSSSDSCYGSDDISDSESSDDHAEKSVRKRANLDHLSPEEKLMRRKLKNRVAAQNARDKKRVKMEEMEIELERLKAHSKALEMKNAELVSQNERLTGENEILRTTTATGTITVKRGQEVTDPLVVSSQSPESAVLTCVPQQKEQGWLMAGGPVNSKASLVMASKLLLNVLKDNRSNRRLPPKKRLWPT